VLVFGDDAIRPYAYTYRDYVTKALNADVPYDRFIIDQLAADQTAGKDESWRLAAMGFLTLGRLFDYNLNDEYDDRIDTVSRGLLGLTVACARCHDHKYDAISQADYYGLYGVFASSEEPAELPLMGPTAATPAVAEFREQFAAKGAGISGTRRHAVSRADGGGAPPGRRLSADRRDDASRPERRRRLLHVALPASTASADRRTLAALCGPAVVGWRPRLRSLGRLHAAGRRRL
jgi:Protein of unknown function (DUF1549)